jgi:hypothetical protein
LIQYRCAKLNRLRVFRKIFLVYLRQKLKLTKD